MSTNSSHFVLKIALKGHLGGQASDFGSGHKLIFREFQPCCQHGAHFGSSVSLCYCPSPACSLPLKNKHAKLKLKMHSKIIMVLGVFFLVINALKWLMPLINLYFSGVITHPPHSPLYWKYWTAPILPCLGISYFLHGLFLHLFQSAG